MKEGHKIFGIVCLFLVVVSVAGYMGYEKVGLEDNSYMESHIGDLNPCHKGGLISDECYGKLNKNYMVTANGR